MSGPGAVAPWSLAYFDLLADRRLRPAALLLRLAPAPVEVLLPLAEAPGLQPLGAALPWFLDAKTPAPLRDALLAAGGALLSPEGLHHCDGPPLELPPGRQWLEGRWHLGPLADTPRSRAGSHNLAFQLMELIVANADNREIETVFRQDPALSYHLLRLVNSAGIGTGRQIDSLSQALLALGRQQLRRWLNLLLFAARRDDPRAAMLLARATVRGRSMELLARTRGLDSADVDRAFMIGMFSLLDVLFGMPLREILALLPLGPESADALLKQEGALGSLLATQLAAESLDFPVLADFLERNDLTAENFWSATLAAHIWMAAIVAESTNG